MCTCMRVGVYGWVGVCMYVCLYVYCMEYFVQKFIKAKEKKK